MKGKKLPLDDFLARLPEQAAAEARAAAARIDELERVAHAMHVVERKYVPCLLLCIALFVFSAVVVFTTGETFERLRGILGGMGLAAMAGALPILGVVYAMHIRERTSADREKLNLNNAYFLPHGGYYFPAGGNRPACVVLTGRKRARDHQKTEPISPGWFW